MIVLILSDASIEFSYSDSATCSMSLSRMYYKHVACTICFFASDHDKNDCAMCLSTLSYNNGATKIVFLSIAF